MKAPQKIFISVLTIVVLVVIFYFITNMITKYTGYAVNSRNPSNLDNFAKCLTSKDVKMYGAFWCGHCQNQKASFGSSWQYITYIECDPRGDNSQSDLCLANKIDGYPTWEINGNLYPGEQSFDKLAELTGCELS